ncbi:hypothetical protein IW261DRAFT_62160 [Armillaria novae-zelandiae]|uniref:Uncharacterized protein n=1 Tax=Armillaria novae-zelandiae TaxID=153914 RepID=A0AA39PV03_9AGAR|nr:hypothetical protein IW261DRAFT_62160 [Armillaria novae-zelandiae]
MPSQHSRPSKRRRGHAQDDEAAVLLPRSEEPLQPESYPRSHHHHSSHHSDNYSSSSASTSRAYYDMNRESSSSRKVDADPWAEERYSYASSSDGYRRSAIDGYEMIGSRDTSNWASRTGTDTARYPSISRANEWEQRYEDYVDPSWKTHSSGYDERNTSYESWPQEDSRRGRSSHPQDRAQRIQASERVVDETGRWQRERRREKSGKTWEPDSGWGSRARESGGPKWEDHSKQSYPALEGPSEDRKWEPAPSWKSSHDEESSRAQNGSTRNGTSYSSHKNAKSSSKKSHNHTKSKRSAEKHTIDDSDFNKFVSCPTAFPVSFSYFSIHSLAGLSGLSIIRLTPSPPVIIDLTRQTRCARTIRLGLEVDLVQRHRRRNACDKILTLSNEVVRQANAG